MSAHLVPLSVVKWAADLVDRSLVMNKVVEWDRIDQQYRGGRPTTLGPRAVFIAWLVVAFEQQPLYATRVAEVLSERLSPEAAEVMGVPASFATVPYEDMQNRVERATNRLLAVFDHKPLPDRQYPTLKGQWASIVADRESRADELEEKRLRFFRFANDLLHAQYDSLPETAKTEQISVSIDATFLAAPSRGMSSDRIERRRDDQTIPMDPDAAWYIRSYDQRDSWDGSEKTARKVGYGYESELAVLVSNDRNYREAVPHIIVGFNFHPASQGWNQRAREIFDDILRWGRGFGYVISDMAYLPGSNPDVLQTPLRRAGAMLSMRYPIPTSRAVKGEGTIQAQAHGAHMVEGQWMCPAAPGTARQAMVEYNKKVLADKQDQQLTKAQREAREQEHRRRRYEQIAERAKWELRVHDTKPDGSLVLGCPAVGKGRSLDCPLKPNQPMDLPEGVVPLPVLSPPKAPGKICTNASSVTFDAELGAKYRQHHRYGSPEWDDMHTYGRQTIESYNKLLKRADNNLRDSTNRRLRGEAAQAFLAAVAVVALNGRVIYQWLDQEYDPDRSAPEPNRRRSRTNRHMPVSRTKAAKKGRGMPAGRRARYALLG
jgi:hypothetical protein